VRPITDPGSAFRLRGRQVEIQTLRDQLDAVQGGRGGIVLLSGLPGMGKTVLLDAAEQMARDRGISTLRGSGDVAAQVIPLGALLEALMLAPGAPVDPSALRNLSHSSDQLFWLLREIQESLERAALRGPMLISVDDVQWADTASLAALGTLPRQLASYRILWLFTFRPTELSMTGRAALARLETAHSVTIELGPLDTAAVASIAQDLLGGAPDHALRQVLSGVYGQPFLLTELLRGLREENLIRVSASTARLVGSRMPLRFIDSVNAQLARLTPGARDALLMASVLGRRFTADELASLTGSPTAAVLAILREALTTGLVIEDGDHIAFRHDLLREAIDATLPRTIRQSLRGHAIEVMLRHDASPSDVAELVMEVAEPGDSDAVTLLRRAAAETGQVSPAIASQLSGRALDLAPQGDPIRALLTAETLAYLVYAGKAAAAVKLMSLASASFANPAAEAEARLSLAILSLQYAASDVVEQCQRALDLPDLPAALRIQLLSFLSIGLDMFGDVSAAERSAMQAAEAARSSDDPANEVVTLPALATQALARGCWQQAIDLAGQAAARPGNVAGWVARLWRPGKWQTLIYIVLARLDEALALIDVGIGVDQRDGISANIRVWSMLRFRALFCSGQLEDARADAEATIEMADEIGDGSYGYINHVALYVLGRIALHTGDPVGLTQARRSAAQLSQARESPSGQRLGAWLNALLADADGDAVLAAQAAVQTLDPLAIGPLSATSPRMYADAATLTRILLAADRRADAESVVIRLEAFASAHQDFPFLVGAAVHARAVLDGDPDIALHAVALSEGDPRRLVRAAVIEDAGRLLPPSRAAEAVPLLETALAVYAAANADRDAARVRSLLRARGVRPSRSRPRSIPQWPELTDSEFAVVSLVAAGATNREVAERLYLSPYTVNSHLKHVFGKLGIRSRVELARLAAERGGLPADHR
jgi:DNA-binding CsgD family transcriptional regulator